MTLYIQDGAAVGHYIWAEQAVETGHADGVIISPFSTPMTPRARHKPGVKFADSIRNVGGEVIFDATTHGASLPRTNSWSTYSTWKLWSGRRGDLTTAAARKGHIERVFQRQTTLGAPSLTPTVTLDNAVGHTADLAHELASQGKSINTQTWQSLAGKREFWLSPDLDTYIGVLQQLESPVWFITLVRSNDDFPPDVTETALTAAFCRTIDSLSRRAKVIVCHADLPGLPAVAAGATGLGTGWHNKQRLFSPSSVQLPMPGQIRIPAKWFTYHGLASRTHNDQSQTLITQDLTRAEKLYAGTVSNVGRDRDLHHLAVLQALISSISASPTNDKRVATLRGIYESATKELNDLARLYGRAFTAQRSSQIDGSYEGLREYAVAEGIW